MLAYLESYVDHFGFRKQITFRTQVVSVIPQLKGGFTVSTKVSKHPLSLTPGPASGRASVYFITANTAGRVC